MNIKPIGDRVVVKPAEAKTTTNSGIILNQVEKPNYGEVLAVGEGRYSDATGVLTPLSVKKGDRVLYGRYGGTEVSVGDEEVLIMRESDIYAVL